MKKAILYQLVNYHRNSSLLQEYFHIPYLDLAILFFYADAEKDQALRRQLIPRRTVRENGWKSEELEEAASYYMSRIFPVRFGHIEEVIRHLEKRDEKEIQKNGEIPMYVLSNARWQFGASSILYPGVLKKISEYLDSDLYLLPSSIHECIVVPVQSVYRRKDLEGIVSQMNETQVTEAEFLSNAVYQYERSGDFLSY